jgi:hypothetical protein
MPVVLVAAVATLLVAYPLERHLTAAHVRSLVRTGLATLAFLVTVRYLLGIIHRRGWRPRIAMLGWIVLTWCVPLLIEAVLAAISADPDRPMSQIALVSPPFLVFVTWTLEPRMIHTGVRGLLAQCGLAAGMWILYRVQLKQTDGRPAIERETADAAGSVTLPPAVPAAPAESTPAVPASPK